MSRDQGSLDKRNTLARVWAERALEQQKTGQDQEALAAAAQALKLDPDQADMWHCIGFLLLKRGRWEEAASYLKQALDVDPSHSLFRSHYAMALMEEQKLAEAYQQTQHALSEASPCPDALFIAGEILMRAGHYDRALSFYQQARQVPSLQRSATFAEGAAHFMTGEFEHGLALLAAADPAYDPLALPDWQGTTGQDQHIVLCGHYGFGDVLHFARYIEALCTKVGKVTLQLPGPLVGLMKKSFPNQSILVWSDENDKTLSPSLLASQTPPDATARCFYMNLPHILGPPFDPKAQTVPYLKADLDRVAFWKEKLAPLPRPHIGIVWAGNPLHQNDHNRSIPFAALEPLIKRAGRHLVSLQRGAGHSEGVRAGLFDASSSIDDFIDSAACMMALDLVISIDSAPAHLAGGLGRPVWTLLPFNPDWRWLAQGERSLWYPTMRLLRQSQPKDWYTPLSQLMVDLDDWLMGRVKSHPSVDVNQDSFLKKHPRALSGF